MERRLFLAGAAGALVTPVLGDGAGRYAVMAAALPTPDAETVRTIGASYRALHPDLDVEQLAFRAFGEDIHSKLMAPTQVRALIARRCSGDFLHGRTVVVEGWVLADSEVAACALIAAVL